MFEFLMYRSDEEDVSVDALIKGETIWPTQKSMAELFRYKTDNISLNPKNIFSEGELEKDAVTEKISATPNDGKNAFGKDYFREFLERVRYIRLEKDIIHKFQEQIEVGNAQVFELQKVIDILAVEKEDIHE